MIVPPVAIIKTRDSAGRLWHRHDPCVGVFVGVVIAKLKFVYALVASCVELEATSVFCAPFLCARDTRLRRIRRLHA